MKKLMMIIAGLAALSAKAELTWTTGSYTPGLWQPSACNILAGVQGEFNGEWYTENNKAMTNNVASLTDEYVFHMFSNATQFDYSKISAIKTSGSTLSWNFPEVTTVSEIRVFSRWADGGRDGISITKVEMKYSGSDEWVDLEAPAVSYGLNDNSSSGSLYAYLADSSGEPIATDATALRLTFGDQDNNGSGYGELEVIRQHSCNAVWTTGDYIPADWTAASADDNMLRGLQAEFNGTWRQEYGTATSISIFTDGEVPGETVDYSKIAAIQGYGGTLAWTFDHPKNLGELRIFSRWGDGGRDGIGIAKLEVKHSGSDDWVDLGIPPVSYGLYVDNNNSSGALKAVLATPSGSPFATNITALRLTFGYQDNDGTGYVEIEAIRGVVKGLAIIVR